MKKIIRSIIATSLIIALLSAAATPVFAECKCCQQEKEHASLYISYYCKGVFCEEKTSSDFTGKSFKIRTDDDTGILFGIWSDSDEEFNIAEFVVTVFKENEVLYSQHDVNRTCIWWMFRSGEKAIISINSGTEASPNWICLKIETQIN